MSSFFPPQLKQVPICLSCSAVKLQNFCFWANLALKMWGNVFSRVLTDPLQWLLGTDPGSCSSRVQTHMLLRWLNCRITFCHSHGTWWGFCPNNMFELSRIKDHNHTIPDNKRVLLIYAGPAINNGYCEHKSGSCFETFHTGSSLRAPFYLFCLKCVCLKIAWCMDPTVQFLVGLIARLCFVCFWCDIQCLAGKDLSGQQETIHHQMYREKLADKTETWMLGKEAAERMTCCLKVFQHASQFKLCKKKALNDCRGGGSNCVFLSRRKWE